MTYNTLRTALTLSIPLAVMGTVAFLIKGNGILLSIASGTGFGILAFLFLYYWVLRIGNNEKDSD